MNCGDTFLRIFEAIPGSLQKIYSMFYVMFKTRAAVLYRDKTRAASFLKGFKNIPGKACVKRVHSNDAFVNVGN